jgi:hypothetical protein
MRCSSAIAGFVVLASMVGCATKEFTFRAVDAETGAPLKGVHVYQRNVRTKTPDDKEHVLWAFDTWHFLPTDEDGVFRCSLDNAHWHVLLFRDQKSCDGPTESDHVEQYVTISPKQLSAQVGDWPNEGAIYPTSSTITVKLQTYGKYWAWLRSPDNPGNKPKAQATSHSAGH